MRIPDHILDQIRRDTDIVEVISDFVALNKRGRNFIGLCPFHNEKTPSFNVLPDKGIFKCFGCGKGGDAITFIREHQKMSYPEAIGVLAQRLGIVLAENDTDTSSGEHNRYENAYNALRLAANYFYKNLYLDIGEEALEYVRLRGFSEETVKKFGLGFSPNSFSATMNELHVLGMSDEALLDAGLVGKKEETGRIYDRFRGRLMFPIQNPMGRVIGFGGRRMNDEDKNAAKYLNSPQSLVYNKSEVLYGIFQAKDALRRLGYALLVEGYADLLSVSQAGFQNVVASSGTALTKEQLRLISRFCKKVKIVYDSDKAGINAALRGLDLAVEEDFDVEIVRLPDGDDPDSIIQRDGADAFQFRIDNALSLVDFKGEIFREQGLLNTPEGSTEAVRSIMETIAKVPTQIKRDFMIRSVAHRFSLREADLYAELTKILRRNSFGEQRERSRQEHHHTAGKEQSSRPEQPSSPRQQPPFIITEKLPFDASNTQDFLPSPETNHTPDDALLPEEEELLRIALTMDGACVYMTKKANISEDLFVTNAAKSLFSLIREASAKDGKPLDTLLTQSAQGVEIPPIIHGLAMRRETPSERWLEFDATISQDSMRMVVDCTLKLKIHGLEREIDRLQTRHNAAILANNEEEIFPLLLQIQELDKQKRDIHAQLIRY
ncbi:MAG: DNA primase [Candidatus Kapabacteria bacterium]|jgi:DNA primase catalytic core|nr:DNA primase [Candidatus Kapabacteria bacterium]